MAVQYIMEFKELDEKRYREYLNDIEIAREELSAMKLLPEQGIICDLYAIPSHNEQAYYAVVYEMNGTSYIVYAKPEIWTKNDAEPIKMYPFHVIKEAKNNPHIECRIMMGVRKLPKKMKITINELLYNMPCKHILSENLVIIDGVLQAIRMFDGSHVVKELVYRMTNKISFPKRKEYLNDVLETFYLDIGKIIQ